MVNQISDEEICPEGHRDEGPLHIPIRIPGSNDEPCLRVPARSGPSGAKIDLSNVFAALAGVCEPALGVSPTLPFNFQLSIEDPDPVGIVNLLRAIPLKSTTSAILESQQ